MRSAGYKRKQPRFRKVVFCAPISRILCERFLAPTTIHLGHVSPHGSSDSHRLSEPNQSTVLHASKDLAVSITCRHAPHLACARASGFRLGRLCSHLADYSVQALPATCLLLAKGVFGLSSPVVCSIEVDDRSGRPVRVVSKQRKIKLVNVWIDSATKY